MMNKFVVFGLAATALVPASAFAQRTVAPPSTWHDTPHAQIRAPAPHVMHSPGQVSVRPPVVVQQHGQAHVQVHNRGHQVHNRGHVVAGHHSGHQAGIRHHRGTRNYSRYHRINRGFALPQAWWGPQYQIHNWHGYGLPQPIHGGRWVRYYDDALMIDGHGRVHDGRWGMGWDRWQDEWSYDDRGVPVYAGNGDYYPDDEDYAWAGRQGGAYAGNGYGYDQGYAHGGSCRQACGPAPIAGYEHPHDLHHGRAYGHAHERHHGGAGSDHAHGVHHGGGDYDHGHGIHHGQTGHGYGQYGYSYGYGGGMVVTETTVTTHPTVVTETYYDEVVHTRRAAKPRKYRAKPKVRYHRPAPPPGERG